MIEGWPPPVLDPAGPYAWAIATLGWVLLAVAAFVLLVVLAALWMALWGTDAQRAKLGGTKVIWSAGIAFPVLVLSLLLFYGLSLTRDLSAPLGRDALRIRVIGEMWFWRVSYLDPQGRPFVEDANEIHIPANQPVMLEITASDVIHSLWVPRLSGKVDMVPGRVNKMAIQANQPGVYGGQCAEYCGGPHALMGLKVIAHEPEAFRRLMAARLERGTAARPPQGAAMAGQRVFQSAGCAACHRIAGTEANGLAGPDLTHVGSRRTLGAGILPNNRGTMMGWIANSQAIKPNNRMPPYTMLSGEELAALASYLEAQK
jgi:cytochrome c oxidase subunit 2